MAGKHTIHESEVEPKDLPGRKHKMIIRPDNLGSEKMCFGVADFPANAHAPGHVHPREEEVLYVLQGSGEIYFDGVAEPVEPGTCILVPPGARHSINNTSDEILRVIYVFSPPVEQGSYDEIKL